MFRETLEEDYGASDLSSDRAAGLRPQPLRVFAEQHPSRAPNPVAELLEKAAATVALGWCQGYAARNADGCQRASYEPDAVRWCALGGIFRHASPHEPMATILLSNTIGTDDVARWNDHPSRTQSEVVDALLRAAALARAQEG